MRNKAQFHQPCLLRLGGLAPNDASKHIKLKRQNVAWTINVDERIAARNIINLSDNASLLLCRSIDSSLLSTQWLYKDCVVAFPIACFAVAFPISCIADTLVWSIPLHSIGIRD